MTVRIVAGTYVVTLAMDLTKKAREGCLGFAIQREDHTEDERSWLRGQRTFEETDPGLGPGQTVSTRQHPVQGYVWSDYTAKPSHHYTYTVHALYGPIAAPQAKRSVTAEIHTELEQAGHAVYFNRGAIASQEYARRFLNKRPDELQGEEREAALRWLSRGLVEALEAFVRRADGKRFALHAAIYEFEYDDVLRVFKAVAANGAKVRIVVDAIPRDKRGALEENAEAIERVGIKRLTKGRTKGSIMHDKFVVLLEDDVPVAVWTGSTNLSLNGLFGHLNCGHVVEDRVVAARFEQIWQRLHDDPDHQAQREWVRDNDPPPPPGLPPAGTSVVFSPRVGTKFLQWYADLAGSADRALFMTFAFGMDERFKEVYDRDDGLLRVALMEQAGNGAAKKPNEVWFRGLRRRRANVLLAFGDHAPGARLKDWLDEQTRGLSSNVQWVHTKFMLVDPLSDDPIVVTGSANFSPNSTNGNDENMLLIRGDTRVADIYFGEFLRTWSHHAFRESLSFDATPQNHLHTDPQTWQRGWHTPGTDRFLRREYYVHGR